MAKKSNITALMGLGLTLLVLLAGFALGEARGWPWLVQPLQNRLTERLERTVQLYDPNGGSSTARLQFWGGLTLATPWLEVAAPAWSQAPHLLQARDVELHLRYTDVWRAWRGQPLVVRSLRAGQLDVVLERRADGTASWQAAARKPDTPPTALPQLEAVEVPAGQLHYSDAQGGLEVQAKAALTNQRMTMQVTARAGPARLTFDGHADDLMHLDRVQGQLSVQGPSLAAMGEPLHVTLPTTAAFKVRGQLQHGDKVWDVVVDSAQVGNSQLNGRFRFDERNKVPVLSGTLTGERLNLVDLGPAVGVEAAPTKGRAKVLPTRPFDLAALRAMDADITIAIRNVDLNTAVLEPLQPLNAQLLLQQGVLTLKDIDARTSLGQLGGTLTLNGQQDRAHWIAALQWTGVVLERWLHVTRKPGLPPYVTGTLQGHADLVGDGRSTAEILASLQGRIVTTVEKGSISHLLIEIGGLDAAQALGVLVSGDKPLPLNCAVADLEVSQGSLRPRVLVLDTSDSTAWIDGTISLAKESLDLRAIVAPKDLSPLSLRTPLHVGGSFAAPTVSVEKGPLGAKLGSALLLGLLNPLAALIPLVDTGSNDAALQHASTCQAGLQKKLRTPIAPSALKATP